MCVKIFVKEKKRKNLMVGHHVILRAYVCIFVHTYTNTHIYLERHYGDKWP